MDGFMDGWSTGNISFFTIWTQHLIVFTSRLCCRCWGFNLIPSRTIVSFSWLKRRGTRRSLSTLALKEILPVPFASAWVRGFFFLFKFVIFSPGWAQASVICCVTQAGFAYRSLQDTAVTHPWGTKTPRKDINLTHQEILNGTVNPWRRKKKESRWRLLFFCIYSRRETAKEIKDARSFS